MCRHCNPKAKPILRQYTDSAGRFIDATGKLIHFGQLSKEEQLDALSRAVTGLAPEFAKQGVTVVLTGPEYQGPKVTLKG